jgi:hypothetical protein
LSAAVSFAERVHLVDLRVVVGQPRGESLDAQVPQELRTSQLPELAGRVAFDVLRKAEPGLLEYLDGSDLPSPREDIAENLLMKAHEMGQVVRPCQRPHSKLIDPSCGNVRNRL